MSNGNVGRGYVEEDIAFFFSTHFRLRLATPSVLVPSMGSNNLGPPLKGQFPMLEPELTALTWLYNQQPCDVMFPLFLCFSFPHSPLSSCQPVQKASILNKPKYCNFILWAGFATRTQWICNPQKLRPIFLQQPQWPSGTRCDLRKLVQQFFGGRNSNSTFWSGDCTSKIHNRGNLATPGSPGDHGFNYKLGLHHPPTFPPPPTFTRRRTVDQIRVHCGKGHPCHTAVTPLPNLRIYVAVQSRHPTTPRCQPLGTFLDELMCMMGEELAQQLATEETLRQTQACLNATAGQKNPAPASNPNPLMGPVVLLPRCLSARLASMVSPIPSGSPLTQQSGVCRLVYEGLHSNLVSAVPGQGLQQGTSGL
ncbi:hypothetical protein VP01_770g1 [Puccinia sorghi]|uniref:Uncharacterized protein n=1 Tax=Puccinia sorghi TaxID=27349 RepID=A0A0L6UBH5_9BASI|nr:hypothetical protein VP01_770g1 [Puccinia sorghi]